MNRAALLDENQALLFQELKTPKEVFRDIRNFLAGQFVGATRDDALLEEVLKCLFCKLYLETRSAVSPAAKTDVIEFARQVRGVFAQVRKEFPDIYDPTAEILLHPEGINMVMTRCYFSIVDAASDPIGDAFEVFAGSESRGRASQFFTPRPVTDLLVQAVDPQPGETIMDPAGGAGGFHCSVARHYLRQGLNAAELSKIATETFCAIDKDAYLVKLAKLHIALLTRGHPRVVCGDSLAFDNKAEISEWPKKGFDVVLTNPPFGVRIVAAIPEVLRTFALARRWRADGEGLLRKTAELQGNVPPQVLFVERCLQLLRPGGRLGMVVPESLLSNKSYRHVVQYILDNAQVQGVIGMPESLFKTSGKGGTHTKTCLLVATKRVGRVAPTRGKIFMAEARWCGHDSRARKIPHNDLPTIAENFATFRKRRRLEESSLGFTVKQEGVVSNVFCPRYYDPQIREELAPLEKTHDLRVFGDLLDEGVVSMCTGDELGKLAYGTGDIPFIRTSDISNWELKADPKHGVDRKIYDSFRRKQDVKPHDLLMVKDGTYLIGTCAIVTEDDTEIVYQSHLYKIRVNENNAGLNPFLLLAVLSCPVVQRQVRAKQFTQDIIDSLGERIRELVLPVPKAPKKREAITSMVKEAVQRRLEARKLAKEARLAVLK